ncbi:MAG TPA: thermonuclease family protein [Kofleriaceae bacterium]|nr:thermonuclease family protein [Kofleriaceae bacterium]
MRALCLVALGACSSGPDTATVARVVDGDTIELASGEKVRYLMVNTPETTGGKNECYGQNAVTFNTDLVLGKDVELRYDVEREDQFGRTLAYVTVDDLEVNRLIIERGFGCVLHIPPNGDDRAAEFEMLEQTARLSMRGLWGTCNPIPCD